MFDLEKAIADWRRQMLAAGIKTPVPLDELESHLCDDMEQQLRSGIGARLAFEIAVKRIGQAGTLRTEFKKNESKLMKRVMIILLGIFVIFVGVGFILPALAKYRDMGIWTMEQLGFLLLGIVIAIVGTSAAILAFKKRRA